ncbi:hypothetical protein EDB89DRAFT_1976654 [Lactarius sanguifluus]|nr:hypothetical protein EDB89DRAFT_1976654 [Lactarius sanguifluus]
MPSLLLGHAVWIVLVVKLHPTLQNFGTKLFVIQSESPIFSCATLALNAIQVNYNRDIPGPRPALWKLIHIWPAMAHLKELMGYWRGHSGHWQ